MPTFIRKKNAATAEPSTRKRDGALTINHILSNAEKLFAKYGFDGVSTKLLATEAGIAIGALYHHFPSKEAVYAAVTKRAFAAKSALPKELLDSRESAEHRLARLVAWFISNVMHDKQFGRLLNRELLDPRKSTLKLLDKDHFQQPLLMFKELISELAPRANVDEAVASLLALIFGFSNLKGIYALFPGMRKTLETPDEIADHATQLLLRGLRA